MVTENIDEIENKEYKKPKTITEYIQMKHFDHFIKKLMIEKKSFKLEKTNYTKKISFEKHVYFFNEDGSADYHGLQLLNKTRRDAKKYMESTTIKKPENIKWSKLLDSVPENSVISKIDVRGAYWNYALLNNIITEDTNRYLLNNYKSSKEMKIARLRALGSLATRKKIYSYIEGQLVPEPPMEKLQETFDLYMSICQGIDNMMFEISSNVDGAFFYYWDCIFSTQDVEREIVEYMKTQKYHTKTDHSLITTERIGGNVFMRTKADQKIYLIRKEEEFMVKSKGLIQNENIFDSMYVKQGSIFV